jgi:hypothetical protein
LKLASGNITTLPLSEIKVIASNHSALGLELQESGVSRSNVFPKRGTVDVNTAPVGSRGSASVCGAIHTKAGAGAGASTRARAA